MKVTISLRLYGGTYLANVVKHNTKASATMGPQSAAEAAARKVFHQIPFVVRKLTDDGNKSTWEAESK